MYIIDQHIQHIHADNTECSSCPILSTRRKKSKYADPQCPSKIDLLYAWRAHPFTTRTPEMTKGENVPSHIHTGTEGHQTAKPLVNSKKG